MPLLDHFRPPLSTQRHWESFHTTWASAIADALNEHWLPEGYFAEEQVHPASRVEIDVATFDESEARASAAGPTGGVATARPPVWSPPAPAMTMPLVFLERYEVAVFRTEGGPTLVAAVELVSPGNKDRPESRRGFAAKCAGYLQQGVSLVIVDVVTTRRANLHNELIDLMQIGEDFRMPDQAILYGVGYRPRSDAEENWADVWPAELRLGESLPVLPLALTTEYAVPLDLEATYQDAVRRRRLI